MRVAVLDIDGTLADNSHREYLIEGPKPDWNAFLAVDLVLADTPIPYSQDGFNSLTSICNDVVFLTGRPETTREVTAAWLGRYFKVHPGTEGLWMRPAKHGGTSPALGRAAFKYLTMFKYIKPLFTNPSFIFVDDEDDNLRMFGRHFGGLVYKAPQCWRGFGG